MSSFLVRGFVVTGFAAGGAVIETIVTQTDIQLALAEAAILLARAARFAHLA